MRKPVEAEIAAARLVAERAGLGAIEPQVLKLAKHTSVRLAPLPIVARIQSSEPIDRAHASASRELTVASHLAARHAPSVRATALVEPGPYVENGCTITLWQLVEGRAVETDADALMAHRALMAVHQGLEDIDIDLPSFTVAVGLCESILSDPAELPLVSSENRVFLERLYADLREELSRRELVCQPLHGDAHFGNVLMTNSGPLWMDLEAVCTGPREWDFLSLPSECWPEFGEFDSVLISLLADLRSLCVSVWCWADFDRSDEVAEAAIYHLDVLKARYG